MSSGEDCCPSCSLGFLVPILLVLVCPFVLIAVGIAVVHPYGFTKHFSEEQTTCTVIGVQEKGIITCDCSDNEFACDSKYLCTMIYVKYTDISSNGTETISNATLFDTAYDYYTLKKDLCSVIKCEQSEEGNTRHVREFVEKYGSLGQTFPCYPGKASDPEALLSVIYRWHVLLGMLLPASVFVVAAVGQILVYFIIPRCKRTSL